MTTRDQSEPPEPSCQRPRLDFDYAISDGAELHYQGKGEFRATSPVSITASCVRSYAQGTPAPGDVVGIMRSQRGRERARKPDEDLARLR